MRPKKVILKAADDVFSGQRESVGTMLYLEVLLDIRDALMARPKTESAKDSKKK